MKRQDRTIPAATPYKPASPIRIAVPVWAVLLLTVVWASVTTSPVSAQEFELPPEDILFADDFMGETVGTFPRSMQFLGGQADLVERGGRRLLRATSNATWFKVPLNQPLTDQFTFEFDLQTTEGEDGLLITTSDTTEVVDPYYEFPFLQFGGNRGTGVVSVAVDIGPTQLKQVPDIHESVQPVRVTVDGQQVQVYIGATRVIDAADVDLPRFDALWFVVPRARDEAPLYLGNLRVARGVVDLQDTVVRSSVPDGEGEGAAEEAIPELGVWDNYNFVAGDKVLFFEDFSEEAAGTFPTRLQLLAGAGRIDESEGNRTLLIEKDNTWFKVPLLEALPDRFTIELELKTSEGMDGIIMTTSDSGEVPGAYYEQPYFHIGAEHHTGVRSNSPDYGPTSTSREPAISGDVTPVRIMVDGDYVQMFVNERRVANVPSVNLPREQALWIVVPRANPDEPVRIANLRVAAGGSEIYQALEESGRVVTRGILFDTGSADIRPESSPVLKKIGAMLSQHPELAILIEGHTDSVGDDASNLDLSSRRAASVKQWLVKYYQISESRMQTKGLGESRPVGANDTPEGRQMNRRVELVKL